MRIRRVVSFFAAVVLSMAGVATADPAHSIVGTWEFYAIVMNGEERPPFNPDLRIEFDFNLDGSDELRWWREGERGGCKRRGRYVYDGAILKDHITWVDPENNRECSQDPDMQFGRTSYSEVAIVEGIMRTRFVVGDQELFYLWRRAELQPEGW